MILPIREGIRHHVTTAPRSLAGRRVSAAARHLTCALAIGGLLTLPIFGRPPGWSANITVRLKPDPTHWTSLVRL
jgi:hypothetical protein